MNRAPHKTDFKCILCPANLMVSSCSVKATLKLEQHCAGLINKVSNEGPTHFYIMCKDPNLTMKRLLAWSYASKNIWVTIELCKLETLLLTTTGPRTSQNRCKIEFPRKKNDNLLWGLRKKTTQLSMYYYSGQYANTQGCKGVDSFK